MRIISANIINAIEYLNIIITIQNFCYSTIPTTIFCHISGRLIQSDRNLLFATVIYQRAPRDIKVFGQWSMRKPVGKTAPPCHHREWRETLSAEVSIRARDRVIYVVSAHGSWQDKLSLTWRSNLAIPIAGYFFEGTNVNWSRKGSKDLAISNRRYYSPNSCPASPDS